MLHVCTWVSCHQLCLSALGDHPDKASAQELFSLSKSNTAVFNTLELVNKWLLSLSTSLSSLVELLYYGVSHFLDPFIQMLGQWSQATHSSFQPHLSLSLFPQLSESSLETSSNEFFRIKHRLFLPSWLGNCLLDDYKNHLC